MNPTDVHKSKGFLPLESEGIHGYADLERECLRVADEELNTYIQIIRRLAKKDEEAHQLKIIAVNPEGCGKSGTLLVYWYPRIVALGLKRDFSNPRKASIAAAVAEWSTARRMFKAEAYAVKEMNYEERRRGKRQWDGIRRSLKSIDERIAEEQKRQEERAKKIQQDAEEYQLNLTGY